MTVYPYIQGTTLRNMIDAVINQPSSTIEETLRPAFREYGRVIGEVHKGTLMTDYNAPDSDDIFKVTGLGERHLGNVIWNKTQNAVYLVDFNHDRAGHNVSLLSELTYLFDYTTARIRDSSFTVKGARDYDTTAIPAQCNCIFFKLIKEGYTTLENRVS
ncbi:MAG: hypothetical protein ACR2PX_23055 [Endozoicomonas sp.]|uniref:hypothetical protein n=1 Tax=Endozoicomonas sp. TaxID=1892382 RepID=UPI003D9B7CB7